MRGTLFALVLLALRVSASVGNAKSGQPNDAFVDKLKALASALGKNGDAGTPVAASGTPEAATVAAQPAPAVATEQAASPTVAAQPAPAVATEQAPPPTQSEESAPAGNFMKSLDSLRSMLGSKATAAVATSPVVAAPSSTEEKPGIEQQLNALKGLLHPTSSTDAQTTLVANAPQSPEQPPISESAQTSQAVAPTPPISVSAPVSEAAVPTGVVVATSTASKDKMDEKSNKHDKDSDDEDDDDDDDNDDDHLVDKMVKHTAVHAAGLKAPVAGAQTNGQRVARMATQYLKHGRRMLNKRRHRTDPIRP